MHPYFIAYVAILFFLLTPGVLLRLPARGVRLVSAFTHGVVFVIALYVTKHVVLRLIHSIGYIYDGFQDAPAMPPMPPPMPEAPMPEPAARAETKPGEAELAAAKKVMADISGMNITMSNLGSKNPGDACSSGSECNRGVCISSRCL